MAEYAKSAETKRRILDACKTLFYEKGYTNTRYSDISALSGINEGLIYYHFKKKDVLGGLVFEEVISEVMGLVSKLTEDRKTLMLAPAVNNRVFWHLINTSEAFRRFTYEILLDRIPVQVARNSTWYQNYNVRYNLGLSTTDIRLIGIAHCAVETELQLAMIEGELELTEKQLADFDIRTELELFKIGYDSIEIATRESAEICRNLQISMRERFQAELIF